MCITRETDENLKWAFNVWARTVFDGWSEVVQPRSRSELEALRELDDHLHPLERTLPSFQSSRSWSSDDLSYGVAESVSSDSSGPLWGHFADRGPQRHTRVPRRGERAVPPASRRPPRRGRSFANRHYEDSSDDAEPHRMPALARPRESHDDNSGASSSTQRATTLIIPTRVPAMPAAPVAQPTPPALRIPAEVQRSSRSANFLDRVRSLRPRARLTEAQRERARVLRMAIEIPYALRDAYRATQLDAFHLDDLRETELVTHAREELARMSLAELEAWLVGLQNLAGGSESANADVLYISIITRLVGLDWLSL